MTGELFIAWRPDTKSKESRAACRQHYFNSATDLLRWLRARRKSSERIVIAYSPDGIVQAVEVEGHPFGLAVQWHPEQTLEDLRLFEALIAAAKVKN
jgi:CTP synthase (UTP-ammonia lyase)